MGLALGTAGVVLVALLWELARPSLRAALARYRSRRAAYARGLVEAGYDPGRERRAEQRARTLLRSCISEQEWEMYRDLGFLRVWGQFGARPRAAETAAAAARGEEDARGRHGPGE